MPTASSVPRGNTTSRNGIFYFVEDTGNRIGRRTRPCGGVLTIASKTSTSPIVPSITTLTPSSFPQSISTFTITPSKVPIPLETSVDGTTEAPLSAASGPLNVVMSPAEGTAFFTEQRNRIGLVEFGSFLSRFPIDDHNPYSAPINSVFDHSVPNGFYGGGRSDPICHRHDGRVIAFTGEVGQSCAVGGQDPCKVSSPSRCLASYSGPNPTFTVNCNYFGAGDSAHLAYDGHPGYDYNFAIGTPIRAPAGGTIRIPTSDPINGTPTRFNTIVIDHGNGFSTWYLHVDRHLKADGDSVKEGEIFATVGGRGTEDIMARPHPHLHFEVRLTVPVDPYGWEGTQAFGADPLAGNITLWK